VNEIVMKKMIKNIEHSMDEKLFEILKRKAAIRASDPTPARVVKPASGVKDDDE